MFRAALLRGIENVRLRSRDEGSAHTAGEADAGGGGSFGRGARCSGGPARNILGGSRGDRCYVSVSRRSAASPGAASARYHEARDEVEILRDDDVAEWKGERVSVVISPERKGVDLVALADRVLEELEARFGALTGGAWLHHAKEPGKRDHLHIAISDSQRKLIMTQATVEKAVERALKTMAKERERGQAR